MKSSWKQYRKEVLSPAFLGLQGIEVVPHWHGEQKVAEAMRQIREGQGPVWTMILNSLSRAQGMTPAHHAQLKIRGRALFEAAFLLNQPRPTLTPRVLSKAEKYGALLALLPDLVRGRAKERMFEPEEWRQVLVRILTHHDASKLGKIAESIRLARQRGLDSKSMQALKKRLAKYHDASLADSAAPRISSRVGSALRKEGGVESIHFHTNFASSPDENYLRELVEYVDMVHGIKPG